MARAPGYGASEVPLTVQAWKDLARRATWELDSIANQAGLGRFSEKAFEESARVEKEHRAMGNRFTRGAARYRLPAVVASQLIILREVARHLAQLEGAPPEDERIRPLTTWREAAETRIDIVNARALAEGLYGRWPAELPLRGRDRFDELTRSAVLAFDYGRDACVQP